MRLPFLSAMLDTVRMTQTPIGRYYRGTGAAHPFTALYRATPVAGRVISDADFEQVRLDALTHAASVTDEVGIPLPFLFAIKLAPGSSAAVARERVELVRLPPASAYALALAWALHLGKNIIAARDADVVGALIPAPGAGNFALLLRSAERSALVAAVVVCDGDSLQFASSERVTSRPLDAAHQATVPARDLAATRTRI